MGEELIYFVFNVKSFSESLTLFFSIFAVTDVSDGTVGSRHMLSVCILLDHLLTYLIKPLYSL